MVQGDRETEGKRQTGRVKLNKSKAAIDGVKTTLLRYRRSVVSSLPFRDRAGP